MYIYVIILRGICCIYTSRFPYDNLENPKGLLKLAKTRKNSQKLAKTRKNSQNIGYYRLL